MKSIFYISLFLLPFFLSCGGKREDKSDATLLHEIKEKGVLKVATLSRSTSFFVLKGQRMGYEYELANRFCKSLGVKMEIITALDMNDLVDKLERKEVDLIAYPLIISNEYKNRVRYTNHEYITNQALVQLKKKNKPLITDVTRLIGKNIHVVENSKYHNRLRNLNDEIGGGIIIHTVSNDNDEEKLIEMVSTGKIALTVADNNIANINKTYFNNIDVSLPVSFVQRSAWAVRPDENDLCEAVNKWFGESKNNYIYQYLYNKYFEKKKNTYSSTNTYISEHRISVFDELFKQYARQIGWDWRLLASIAYQESHFNPDAESWAGARGLMQLMPATAAKLGATDIFDPEQNLSAAVKYLQNMNHIFNNIEDKNDA